MTLSALMRGSAVAALAAVALGSAALAADWRGWNIHPEGYPNTIALEHFAAEIGARTGGRVSAQVYNSGVLGAQTDAIEQLRSGALDFANFNLGPMGEIVPQTNVLSLPFLFTGVDQMHAAMDGAPGETLSEAMSAEGIVALAWFDSGARSFYNTKKPITTPADLDGLKIRVMNNQLYVDMVDGMGGNATPMAYGEVYQSLKTGVLDGAENNYPSYESSNHYEVAKFYSLTEHLILPECVCIAKSSWEALSPEDQAAVRAAAIDAARMQRELWAARETESLAKVEAAGTKVNAVADKAAFQAKMAPVYEAFYQKNPDLRAFVEEIRATRVK
ncbi:MAG: TRAP transporter substrate-binding protein [Thermohalobaculum sp.]|nr:TRAP transporter substrate-binding protein [Thermohalobaculum sp.]